MEVSRWTVEVAIVEVADGSKKMRQGSLACLRAHSFPTSAADFSSCTPVGSSGLTPLSKSRIYFESFSSIL
jgi:hypothetical protein